MVDLGYPKYGDNVIPPNRTKLEFDLYRLIRDEFQDIPVPYRTFLRPLEIDRELLPFLSWTLNVNLWKTEWSDEKKRSVTARSFELHSLKGTEEGIRQHIDIMGGTVVQVVKPPQGFFIGPDLSKEQWDDFIRQQPQLRISVDRQKGTRDVGLFLDVGFMDDEFLVLDDGIKLYGRKAVVRRNGIDTPLSIFTQTDDVEARLSRQQIKTSLRGLSSDGLFLDVDHLDNRYLDGQEDVPRIISLELRQTYDHVESQLQLSLVEPGFEPLDPRFERVSDIGDAGPYFFLDGDAPDAAFLGDDLGYLMLADRIYLNDPSVVAPLVDGLGFLDHTRIARGHTHMGYCWYCST